MVDAGNTQPRDAGRCALPAFRPTSQASTVMSFESFTGVLASCMGIAMSMAPLLQARRVHRIGDSSEISIGFFVIFALGACAWVLRGAATGDVVILIPNAVSVVVQVVTLLVVLRHRPRPAAVRR
jgi:uncharacterized protein with PQ loop repeat